MDAVKSGIVLLLVVFMLLLSTSSLRGDETGPVQPSDRDKCPVCGMFVAKYPDWVGQIVYKDGFVVFFDGAKDLFKYYFDINKYHPKRTREDIRAVYVTEYYDLRSIDARTAFFVVDSDIYGPMGRELIPFETEADARTFMKDHLGKRIVGFEQVNPELIRRLDE